MSGAAKGDGPINILAEKAILGGVLKSESEYWLVSRTLKTHHFYLPLHQRIYSIIADICESGQRLSLTLVASRLPEETEDGSSMMAILAVLVKNADDAGSPLDYVADVIDVWSRRQALAISKKLAKGAMDGGVAMADLISDIETEIIDVARGATLQGEESMASVMDRVLLQASKVYKDEFVPGFDTGLPSLDTILGRIMPGDLGFIGGGVGEGKTSLLTQIMGRASERVPTLLFEHEMQSTDVGRRMLASETGLTVSAIEEGEFNFDEYERMAVAQQKLKSKHFYIDETPRLRCSQIRQRCLSMKRSRGLSLVGIDHLKLVQADGKVRDIFERIDYVTGFLKAMAKELEVPVLVLTQRTRKSWDRDDPKPLVSDFFGGGSIEENADFVLGIWRRDRFLKHRKPRAGDTKAHDQWVAELEKYRDLIEIVCLKRRRGGGDEERKFYWNGKATRVEELSA